MSAVAIVGSRDYPDLDAVRAFVATLPAGTVVVTGTRPPRRDPETGIARRPRGVDEAAAQAAEERGLAVVIYEADWTRHGRAAGPIRNTSIAEHCDTLTAFRKHGVSAGTDDVCAKTRRLGKPVEIRQP